MRASKLVLILGSAVAASSAFGQVDYDNLLASTSGNDPVASFGPLYDSFSVGSTGVTVSSVLLNVFGGVDGNTFTVGIYSDNSTSPDALLNSTVLPDGSGIVLANFGATALAPNTRYWIGLSSPTGGSDEFWNWSMDISGPGVAGEFFYNQSGLFPNSDSPYQMLIASTPEPSSFAFLGLGVLPLFLRRRRK